MLLSVIIPLYNNAPYLRECIDSLYRQGILESDFEVVIIDDGSTDGGGDLADQIATEHPNIQVYHQPNQGTGNARNAGLQKAQGDYIHYVDPDDFLFDHSYQHIVQELLQGSPDILCFGYANDGTAGTECQKGDILYQGLARDYYATRGMRVNLPFKWLKRSFIAEHHLTFPPLCYGEDTVFTWDALRYANTLVVSNGVVYSYRTKSGSAVNGRTIEHIKSTISDLIYVNLQLRSFAKDYIGCRAVRSNFTHKYRVLFDRILCTPFTYDEITQIFAQCAPIGTRHLALNVRMWWVNYLYHHPKLYFTAQRLIIVIYFGLNPNIAQSGDFLTHRATDGSLRQRIDHDLSQGVFFFIKVWNYISYHIGTCLHQGKK